ncbi:MAG: AI-2E family transporter [Pirellulales bacterium]|nr:AI-2E family transporter [Pirellulales bacterium]
MPRVISFIVLLAIVMLVGTVFFQVMAQFLVPLFLACVLLVVFQPLHRWMLRRLPTYPRMAALATTISILLVVLLPMVWLSWKAYVELHSYLAPPGGVVAVELPLEEKKPEAVEAPPAEDNDKKPPFQKNLEEALVKFRDWFKEQTGITINNQNIDDLIDAGKKFLTAKVLSGLQTAVGVLVGLAIMILALYYFLADGPAMIDTVLDLSPLDYRYEQELLERFGDVSRAVVVATLLSAVVQGMLAGVGYYFALPSEAPIFLLTAATMATALVPFVGAAFMWILVCGYVYLFGEHVVAGQLVQGDPKTAIILAVYCTIVVSGIDNVIKPFILHGQSKLHPLLALLSILGGVQVLGPVGILVGPMLVSFLQALLNMLRKELDSFSTPVLEGAVPQVGSAGGDEQKLGDGTTTEPAPSSPSSPAGEKPADAKAAKSPAQGEGRRRGRRK